MAAALDAEEEEMMETYAKLIAELAEHIDDSKLPSDEDSSLEREKKRLKVARSADGELRRTRDDLLLLIRDDQ